MQLILLSIHLLVCLALIGLVLLQRSEGGALGMGGGGGALMSGRGAADALARMTQFAGGFFLVTSLGLTVLSGAAQSSEGRSVMDLFPRQQSAPATTTPAPTTTTPARPDPTESSLPSDNSLASLAQPQAAEAVTVPAAQVAVPPPGQATQRATALNGATQAGPIQASANNQQRVATNTAPVTTRPQPPATTTQQQRTGAGTTQTSTTPRQQTTAQRTTPLILPNTAGVVEDPNATPISPESGQGGSGVEAVRRERAGPDQ